jgi:hypothetical protein
MTRPRTPTTRPPAGRVPAGRSIYEVRTQDGRALQLEASSAGDLAAQLARAGLDPYGSRAAAHVLHVLGCSITGPVLTARRLGVLQFQPDPAPQTARQPHRTAQEGRQRPDPAHRLLTTAAGPPEASEGAPGQLAEGQGDTCTTHGAQGEVERPA